jgi:hypothetical protein
MSEKDAASSAEGEIDENTLTNIPININDKDLIKKITKNQLVEIIKKLSKDIESLKVKPLPTIETQEDKPPNPNLDPAKLSDPSKPSDSSTSSDLFKPVAWDTHQIEAFMRSQNEVNNSFEFNENSQENTNKSAFSEKNPLNSRQAGVLTQVITHEFDNYRPPDKKILKLDPNTPKFHGNVNEDVDDWLYKVKINLEITQIPADKYFDYLTNYCVGKAGIFMRRLRESYESKFSRMTWQMFKDSFIKRYRPFDHIRRIRNQLIQLRQGNDFSSFVVNFQQLLNQVDSNEFSQHEKLHYFIEG